MRRIPLSALIVAGSLILGGGIAAAQGSLPTSGSADGTSVPPSYLTDDAGRSLILRGFNTASSAKSAPDGMPKFTEADLEREHADMGTNFVRFLISWRSVEPEPGQYDQKYLDRVDEIKANIARADSDIDGIRRELSRLSSSASSPK